MSSVKVIGPALFSNPSSPWPATSGSQSTAIGYMSCTPFLPPGPSTFVFMTEPTLFFARLYRAAADTVVVGEVCDTEPLPALSAVPVPVTVSWSPFLRSPETFSTAGTATACPSAMVPRLQVRS